jgi:hypothetical protein
LAVIASAKLRKNPFHNISRGDWPKLRANATNRPMLGRRPWTAQTSRWRGLPCPITAAPTCYPNALCPGCRTASRPAGTGLVDVRERTGKRCGTNAFLFTDIDGYPDYVVCPGSLTLEEMADGILREVTMEVGIMTDGRVLTRTRRDW